MAVDENIAAIVLFVKGGDRLIIITIYPILQKSYQWCQDVWYLVICCRSYTFLVPQTRSRGLLIFVRFSM